MEKKEPANRIVKLRLSKDAAEEGERLGTVLGLEPEIIYQAGVESLRDRLIDYLTPNTRQSA